MATTWAFVVGEYPPQRGGVADYAFQVAEALCAQGDIVHVYAPATDRAEEPGSARVHRVRGKFGPRSLVKLIRDVRRHPKPRRVFVQYTAQSFGMRALNFPLVLALCTLRHAPLWVMFHEFAIRDAPKEIPARRLLALGTRLMARLLATFADKLFVSTPAWSPVITKATGRTDSTWLPIPSNVSTTYSQDSSTIVRSNLNIASEAQLIGHFGTYRTQQTRRLLQDLIPALLENPARHFLLLGRNSQDFAALLFRIYPHLATRVFATGGLSSSVLAAHLSACDVLIQPYPDGVTSRRGTLVAGLALGIPTITNFGPLTEDFWASSDALLIAPVGDTQKMIDLAESVLANAELSLRTRASSLALYDREFELRHTIETLRTMRE